MLARRSTVASTPADRPHGISDAFPLAIALGRSDEVILESLEVDGVLFVGSIRPRD